VPRVAADRLTLPDPAAAVMVPAPQLPVRPFGVATTMPDGRVSVNATPVSETVLADGLVTVKLSEVVPFSAMPEAPNALPMDGGAITARFAEAVPPVPPFAELTAPVVLLCAPAAAPVTFTEKVHELLAASVAAERLIALVPCVAVIEPPPQVPVTPLGVETKSPVGRVSLKATPVRLCVALLF